MKLIPRNKDQRDRETDVKGLSEGAWPQRPLLGGKCTARTGYGSEVASEV